MYGTEWESYHNYYLHFLYKLKNSECPCKWCFCNFHFDCFFKIFFRKSEETVDATVSKIARTECNIIKINKRPATSLESINNKGINSVSINSTSPTLDSAPGHRNSSLNNASKPKVVKLNRKTLGLNLNKSLEPAIAKVDINSTLNGGAQKVIYLIFKGCPY